MSRIRCIVIEDEPLAIRLLEDYISNVPFLELQGTFKNALLAMEFLGSETTDLIFLDIHLPKLKGMAFLRTLKDPPPIVVTTAYHQYAVEGFELNVTDYLLKPFDFERFLTAVNKVRSIQGRIRTDEESEDKKDFIFINVQKKKVKVIFDDILYIESQREYIKVVTRKATYTTKMSTNEIELLLPLNQFKRVHRSFIVSIPGIESYTSEILEIGGVTIPIGREYKDIIKNL